MVSIQTWMGHARYQIVKFNRDGVANSLFVLQPWGTTDCSVSSDYRLCYCGKQILNVILKADFYAAAVYHVHFEDQVTVVPRYLYWFNCANLCSPSCYIEPCFSINYTNGYEFSRLWSHRNFLPHLIMRRPTDACS